MVSVPEAGNYGIGYRTELGDFVLLVKTTGGALIYVGLQAGDVVSNVGAYRIPETVALPEALFVNMALPSRNGAKSAAVTLLAQSRVILVSSTDVSYCQGNEDCVLNEVLNWVVQTPSFTWPNGGHEGALRELYDSTPSASAKTALRDIAGEQHAFLRMAMSFGQDKATREMAGGCYPEDAIAGCQTSNNDDLSEEEAYPPEAPTPVPTTVPATAPGGGGACSIALGGTCAATGCSTFQCAFSACCSGYCSAASAGTCCSAVKGACTSNADCCSGAGMCPSGTCCRTSGAPATDATECCSGAYSGGTICS